MRVLMSTDGGESLPRDPKTPDNYTQSFAHIKGAQRIARYCRHWQTRTDEVANGHEPRVDGLEALEAHRSVRVVDLSYTGRASQCGASSHRGNVKPQFLQFATHEHGEGRRN